MGVGGVSEGRDVLEYMMAGASAVQVGSAVAGNGPAVFGTIERELEALMTRLGHSSVKDIIGVAVPEVNK